MSMTTGSTKEDDYYQHDDDDNQQLVRLHYTLDLEIKLVVVGMELMVVPPALIPFAFG